MKKAFFCLLLLSGTASFADDCDKITLINRIQSGLAFDTGNPNYPTQDAISVLVANCRAGNRQEAVNIIQDATPSAELFRAILLTLLDELNNRREWDAGMKAAVAASTSLSDLKTRIATLPDAPDITVQQAKTAVQQKINSGSAD